ncbi:MAG: NYN domain-containing protein [Planctomycetes bacterium]|nr:NYN domain-containing protein [Planctomycetota bacterium]
MSEPTIAVFIDFENLALGVKDLRGAKSFKIELVLKRLLEKGRVVYKRAYSDWNNYRDELREFHSQGIELVDIPQSKMSGKNSADIRMVVDAIDLCHTKVDIDTFALVSGDSDFSPLVAKLKENSKRVIGCGIKSSTSQLLVANCDEFIYYDDLVRATAEKPRSSRKKTGAKKTTRKRSAKTPAAETDTAETKSEMDKGEDARLKVLEIVRSLQGDYDTLWGSMVKQAVRRVHPGFQESYHGYRTFAELLEDMAERGYIELEYDKSRGNYKVTLVS